MDELININFICRARARERMQEKTYHKGRKRYENVVKIKLNSWKQQIPLAPCFQFPVSIYIFKQMNTSPCSLFLVCCSLFIDDEKCLMHLDSDINCMLMLPIYSGLTAYLLSSLHSILSQFPPTTMYTMYCTRSWENLTEKLVYIVHFCLVLSSSSFQCFQFHLSLESTNYKVTCRFSFQFFLSS